jgi:polyferredoxin
LASSNTSAAAYVFGIIVLFGLFLGRVICGFLCPFGLIQELFYKIKTPKLKKSRVTRVMSYFKYVILAIMLAVPFIYVGIPAFCKYICPAGTLEGAVALLAHPNNSDYFSMLGYLFSWKFALLVLFVIAFIFIYRFFCRFFCPLGAIYGFFCRLSMLGIKLDKSKCVDCGKCLQTCKMDINHVGDHECINCGECIPVCPTKAITWKGSKIFVKATTPVSMPVPQTESVNLTSFVKPVNAQAEAEGTAQGSQENAKQEQAKDEVKDEREI